MARVLIVDDETSIRTMLRLALLHVGHTVETAADGYEGLEKFGPDGAGWDLVLLDHRMPGLEGIDVLREMRRRRRDARVVMITAFGTIDLAGDALQAGATDFLRKPFTVETLREAVAAALSGDFHLPHVANAVPLSPLAFERIGINGYRLESLPGLEHLGDGAVGKTFSVQKLGGPGRSCRVVLPAYLMELVRAHADCESLPGGDSFWEALCGEALANHLWQMASLPPGDTLTLEDLTRGLRHWIDAVLQREAAEA